MSHPNGCQWDTMGLQWHCNVSMVPQLQMTPTSIEHILGVWEKLGPMERSVLNTIAYRLLAGQREHGLLDERKKVWTWETAEEAMDQCVYLAGAMVAFTEESKRRYFQGLKGDHYSTGGLDALAEPGGGDSGGVLIDFEPGDP